MTTDNDTENQTLVVTEKKSNGVRYCIIVVIIITVVLIGAGLAIYFTVGKPQKGELESLAETISEQKPATPVVENEPE